MAGPHWERSEPRLSETVGRGRWLSISPFNQKPTGCCEEASEMGNVSPRKDYKKQENGDLPGDPALKTSSSNAGVGSIPGQGTKIPHASQPEDEKA